MALEGVAALSIACNVLQLIQEGKEAIKWVGEIYSKGRSIQIAEVEAHTGFVRSAVKALQRSSQKLSDRQWRDQNLSDLRDISEECLILANKLQECIASIPKSNQKRDFFSIALWVLRKKSKIGKIKRRLDVYQHDLDTRVLINLRQVYVLIVSLLCNIREWRRYDGHFRNLDPYRPN